MEIIESPTSGCHHDPLAPADLFAVHLARTRPDRAGAFLTGLALGRARQGLEAVESLQASASGLGQESRR